MVSLDVGAGAGPPVISAATGRGTVGSGFVARYQANPHAPKKNRISMVTTNATKRKTRRPSRELLPERCAFAERGKGHV